MNDRPIIKIAPADTPSDMNIEERLVYLNDQVAILSPTPTTANPRGIPSPSVTTGLTGSGSGVQFTFQQLSLGGIDGYRVYKNSSNSFVGASAFQYVKQGTPAISITVHDVTAAGSIFYYWVTAVDTTGRESAPTAAQAGSVTSGSVVAAGGSVVVGGVTSVDSSGNLILKNIGQGAGTTVAPTTATSTFTTLQQMQLTITTSGNKVLVVFNGIFSHSLAGGLVQVRLYRDGSNVGYECAMAAPAAGNSFPLPLTWLDSPAAGSRAYEIRWATTSGTATALATQRALQIVELG